MATFKARTRATIFEEFMAAKANYSNLDGLKDLSIADEQTLFDKLKSTTRVSLWILWIHLQSFAIWTLENILEIGITEQEKIRDSSFIGNASWVEYATKLFQVGDEVSIDNETNKISYPTEDSSKQIIEHTVANSLPGAAIIKIRRKDNDILSTDELTQFSTYWNRIGILGVNYVIQNSNPDIIKIIGNIRYKGEKSEGGIRTEVESTINNYIRNISFNSEFVKNELLKLVLAIDGVTDFEINDIQAKSSTGSYSAVNFRYLANAGYLQIDNLSPLSNSLTYTIEKIY